MFVEGVRLSEAKVVSADQVNVTRGNWRHTII
jgi:hypothetical protein